MCRRSIRSTTYTSWSGRSSCSTARRILRCTTRAALLPRRMRLNRASAGRPMQTCAGSRARTCRITLRHSCHEGQGGQAVPVCGRHEHARARLCAARRHRARRDEPRRDERRGSPDAQGLRLHARRGRRALPFAVRRVCLHAACGRGKPQTDDCIGHGNGRGSTAGRADRIRTAANGKRRLVGRQRHRSGGRVRCVVWAVSAGSRIASPRSSPQRGAQGGALSGGGGVGGGLWRRIADVAARGTGGAPGRPRDRTIRHPIGAVLFEAGIVEDGATAAHVVAPPSGRPLETLFEAPFPACSVLAFSAGRLLGIRGHLFLWSEPFRPGVWRPSQNFIQLAQPGSMIAPTQDGVYVGTLGKDGSGEVIFLAGFDYGKAGYLPVTPYGAYRGTLVDMPHTMQMGWASPQGFVIADNGGQVTNLSFDKVAFPLAMRGGSMVREEDGIRQIVTGLSGTGPVNNFGAADYFNAYVVKGASN